MWRVYAPKYMLFTHPLSTRLRVLVITTAIAGTLLATDLTSSGVGDLQGQISASRAAVASLQSAIAADTARIRSTTDGLNQARGQLDTLQAELNARETTLETARGQLQAARAHLQRLEARLRLATRALAANLVARYENAPPDLMTVLVESHGFSDLLEQMNFLKRIGKQDAAVTTAVRIARGQVASQTEALAVLERRDRNLVDEVLGRRNQVAALKVALARRQIAELAARSAKASKLHTLNARLSKLQAQAAAQAAASAAAGGMALGTQAKTLPSAANLAGGPVENQSGWDGDGSGGRAAGGQGGDRGG